MGFLTIANVKISGVAACVPKRVEENVDLPFFANREEAEKVIASTGIARKRVCEKGITSSDLAVPAVERRRQAGAVAAVAVLPRPPAAG